MQERKESALRKHQFVERGSFYGNGSLPGKLTDLVQGGTGPGKALPKEQVVRSATLVAGFSFGPHLHFSSAMQALKRETLVGRGVGAGCTFT